MILWIVYLSVFADHLTIPTYNNYLQFIFPKEQESLMKGLIFTGGASFFVSCMIQSWSLERFGKKYLREIIALNLLINACCVMIFSFLPTKGAASYCLWIPLRLFANILSSELYAPFVIQKLFSGNESKRSLANAGTLAFQCLGSVIAVIMPTCNVDGRLAFRISSSIGLSLSVICYFALRSSPLFKEENFDSIQKSHSLQDDDDVEKELNDDVEKELNGVEKELNDDVEKDEKKGHTRIIQIFTDPFWLLTAAFIFFRICMSGAISFNVFVRVTKRYKLSVGTVSIIQLIQTVANVALGMLFSLPLCKISHNDLKLGILTIFSAILCFLYDTVESRGLYGVVALGSCYWILDFCISVPTLMRVSEYASKQHSSIATKILTGTLSISYIGGIVGAILASFEIPALDITIKTIVIILCFSILFYNKTV